MCASRRLREIWLESEPSRQFRGTDWMPEPCRSCELREVDWGGCRCQALAFAGDAGLTDPACAKSPLHAEFAAVAGREAMQEPPPFAYRNPRAATGG